MSDETPNAPKPIGGKDAVNKIQPKQMAKAAASKAVAAGTSEETQEKIAKAQEVAHKAQMAGAAVGKGAAAAKAGVAGTVAALGNPITWIVIVVVIVLVLLLAVVQVVGKNENADGCYGVGGDSGSSVEMGADLQERMQNIGGWLTTTKFEFLGGNPMSKEQAAGVIGNMAHESASTLDPKMTQGGSGISQDATNDEIIAIGTGYNKAVGLVQWDGGRRKALAEFANEKGGKWNDLDIQLQYFQKELEEQYGPAMNEKGFNDSGVTLEKAADIFVSVFEIPAKDGSGQWLGWDERMKYANEFFTNFTGGSYNPGSGGSCRNGGSDLDMSDAVNLAISLSYPTSEESRVDPGDQEGVNKALPTYIEAKKKAGETAGGPDPWPTLYASCDRFVATVVRLTMDEEIPWGATSTQAAYLSNSPKWEQYTKKSEAQPGDIWVTRTNGHIILYLGDVEGQDTIAHASYMDRVAALGDAGYLNESLVDTGGRAYYGYHFVG